MLIKVLDLDMVSGCTMRDMNTITAPITADSATEGEECEIDLGIGGMTCASCVGRVERALRNAPGGVAASASLATGGARVNATKGADTLAVRLRRAVRDAGYEPRAIEADANPDADRLLGVPRDAW